MRKNNFDIIVSGDEYKKAGCPHIPWLSKISDQHQYKCEQCGTILKLKDDINLKSLKEEFETISEDAILAFNVMEQIKFL